jgi:hypothetical protein
MTVDYSKDLACQKGQLTSLHCCWKTSLGKLQMIAQTDITWEAPNDRLTPAMSSKNVAAGKKNKQHSQSKIVISFSCSLCYQLELQTQFASKWNK